MKTSVLESLFNKDADFQATICYRKNPNIFHFVQFKAQKQLSKKRYFEKELCDKEHLFSAL